MDRAATKDSALPSQPPPLGAAPRFWYGLGQVAEGVKNHCFAAFLLFYYTQVLGLPGGLAGLALLIALVFDAVTDPLAGVLSDRLHSPLGRRHPFMYASALPLGVGFYFVFAPPPGLDETGLFLWLLGFAVATRAAMTLYHVPHMALGAELSTDYEERTRIVLARTLAGAAGTFLAGGVALVWYMRPTPEHPQGQLNPAAYPGFAELFALVMVLTILASALGTHARIPWLARPDRVTRPFWLEAREVLGIRSFRAIFLGATVVFIAFGVTNSLGLHLATYLWHVSPQQLFYWGLGAGAGTIGGMLIWTRVAARIDKKPTFRRGLLIFMLFAVLPLLAKVSGWFPPEESAVYLPLFIACGTIYHFGLAACVVTGGSMMADVTDQDELLHGRRREGVFFGATAFAAKSSVGVGSFVAGQLVDWVGLVPGAEPAQLPPEIGRQLGLAAGLVLLVLGSLAFVLFSRYRITRALHAEIRTALDARSG